MLTAYEDALEDVRCAADDIKEVESFIEREQFVTAVHLMNSILHGLERAFRAFPEFENDVQPHIQRLTELTQQVIAKHPLP